MAKCIWPTSTILKYRPPWLRSLPALPKLNDFMPHALNVRRSASHAAGKKGVATGGFVAYLGAADLAAIYNFNPLFKAGITGKGQTIALIEDTNQYSVGDWAAFRSVLGLTAAFPYGTLTQVNPRGSNTCARSRGWTDWRHRG